MALKWWFSNMVLIALSLCLCSFSPPCDSRSGDIIEPLLKKQWFVRCDEMAKKAIQVSLRL